MAIFTSHSPIETQAFAEAIGQRAQAGLLIGLVGDLGAGKTQFVKGLARGLGVTEPVLSPTFSLLHIYASGRLSLNHLDFYRLAGPDQIIAAGLDEFFSPTGITVIEWWDRWEGPNPPELWKITLETLNETERRLSYDHPGP